MAKYLLLCSWLAILKTSSRCGLPIFLKVNHRLESRMQEICQSGSEGGAKRTFVPTPILNVQVIRSYSWAATEEPHNSQCKPVNNWGGSHDFPETLVSS